MEHFSDLVNRNPEYRVNGVQYRVYGRGVLSERRYSLFICIVYRPDISAQPMRIDGRLNYVS